MTFGPALVVAFRPEDGIYKVILKLLVASQPIFYSSDSIHSYDSTALKSENIRECVTDYFFFKVV